MEHKLITKANIQSPFYKLPHEQYHNFMFKPMTDQSRETKPKHIETSMDNNENEQANIGELILHGCKLARELESNITRNNLMMSSQQGNMLSKSLDEIIEVFVKAKERVHSQESSSSSTQHNMLMQEQIDHPMVQEWLRSNCAQAAMLDIIQRQLGSVDTHNYSSAPSSLHGIELRDSAAGELQPQIHPMGPVSDSRDITIASSSQRPRRRKDHGLIKKFTVPAPRIGNTEIPPEDGFTWRKYGQKEIMGCRFPRGYYRCTHQKLYQCPAKKQVQRLDNDPLTYEVMYRSDHTCHMSATAPSILQSISAAAADHHHHISTTQTTCTSTTSTAIPTTSTHDNQPPTSLGIGTWLSMDFNPVGSSGGGGGRGGGGDGDGGVGTSTTATRYGKEVEFPVMDLADAMFNSGSSSSNSMDFIFTSTESKWDSGDKKKN